MSRKSKGKGKMPIIITSPPSDDSSDGKEEQNINKEMEDMDRKLAERLQYEEWKNEIGPEDSDSGSSYTVLSSEINDWDSDDTKAKKLSIKEEERILHEEIKVNNASLEYENNKRKNTSDGEPGPSKRRK